MVGVKDLCHGFVWYFDSITITNAYVYDLKYYVVLFVEEHVEFVLIIEFAR